MAEKISTVEFKEGFKDGIPIGLGYFAVSFALGIAMKNAGLTALQGFFMSLFNLASAGEYAGTQVILSNGTYLQMAMMTLVANARYLLMSCSLSQHIHPSTSTAHRLAIGYGVTDEIFGIEINRPLYTSPYYGYGAIAASALPWCIGTSFGILMGNVLPARIVSALSVALYGMFLAIIIPPARKNMAVMTVVVAGFLSSWILEITPWFSSISSGNRIIILTVIIASIAAIVKPVKEEQS